MGCSFFTVAYRPIAPPLVRGGVGVADGGVVWVCDALDYPSVLADARTAPLTRGAEGGCVIRGYGCA